MACSHPNIVSCEILGPDLAGYSIVEPFQVGSLAKVDYLRDESIWAGVGREDTS